MKRFTAYLIPAAAVMAALLSPSCEQHRLLNPHEKLLYICKVICV